MTCLGADCQEDFSVYIFRVLCTYGMPTGDLVNHFSTGIFVIRELQTNALPLRFAFHSCVSPASFPVKRIRQTRMFTDRNSCFMPNFRGLLDSVVLCWLRVEAYYEPI